MKMRHFDETLMCKRKPRHWKLIRSIDWITLPWIKNEMNEAWIIYEAKIVNNHEYKKFERLMEIFYVGVKNERLVFWLDVLSHTRQEMRWHTFLFSKAEWFTIAYEQYEYVILCFVCQGKEKLLPERTENKW